MHLRIVGAAIGALLLNLSCSELSVRATSHAAGGIVATGQMIAARFDHAAVLLPTGVLIVGGLERNRVTQPSAELFDLTTGRFTATGRLLAQLDWGVTATRTRGEQLGARICTTRPRGVSHVPAR